MESQSQHQNLCPKCLETPALFEAELRAIWSKPDSRKTLLTGLEDKGLVRELEAVRELISAEKSDLFDVLIIPILDYQRATSRETKRGHLRPLYEKQQEFINFVLQHYVDKASTAKSCQIFSKI